MCFFEMRNDRIGPFWDAAIYDVSGAIVNTHILKGEIRFELPEGGSYVGVYCGYVMVFVELTRELTT